MYSAGVLHFALEKDGRLTVPLRYPWAGVPHFDLEAAKLPLLMDFIFLAERGQCRIRLL